MSVFNQMLAAKERFARQQRDLKEQLASHWSSIEGRLSVVKLDALRSNWWHQQIDGAAVPSVAVVEETQVESSGDELVGEWFFVSQQTINQFAAVTLDEQWIHVDEQRAAAESPYKSTVAHGFLLLSLIPALVPERNWRALLGREPSMIINIGLESVRFMAALKSNSYVRASTRTVALTPVKRGYTVTEEVSIESKSGKTIAVAKMIYRAVLDQTVRVVE